MFFSAFSSRVFKIVVGPSAKTFYAHADIIGKSDVLRMVVQGGGKETEEGNIVWPDWSVSGAEKFLEWLYTGDYKCPYPRTLSEKEVDSGKEWSSVMPDEITVVGSDASGADRPGSDTCLARLSGHFCLQSFDASEAVIARTGGPLAGEPLERLEHLTWPGCYTLLGKSSQAQEFDKWAGHQPRMSNQLNYEATFLAHAELYAMACHYLLGDLKNLAWQRLRSVLITVSAPPAGSTVMGNVATLISYAYKNTSYEPGCTEPLRKLVTTFAALNFVDFRGLKVDELMMSKEVTDREFVLDLMLKAMQKMDYLETKSREAPLGSTDQEKEAQEEIMPKRRVPAKKRKHVVDFSDRYDGIF
ncbi:MAG: hypothetical protein Q9172_001180 [Xanthocarpia lactea]